MSDADWAAESSYAEWAGSQREAEIERLRALVEFAYKEALWVSPQSASDDECWLTSLARERLDADTR